MNDQDRDSRESDHSPNCRPRDWHASVYAELHQIAKRALRHEEPGHSLQPTLLVNDAYLRLLDQRNLDANDRTQIMAAGAQIIRRLLVDYARKRHAIKRGGNHIRVQASLADAADKQADRLDVIALNDALDELSAKNARAARVVEMKFFGGLAGEEMADVLKVSLSTVNNDWRFAKAFLHREMNTNTEHRD